MESHFHREDASAIVPHVEPQSSGQPEPCALTVEAPALGLAKVVAEAISQACSITVVPSFGIMELGCVLRHRSPSLPTHLKQLTAFLRPLSLETRHVPDLGQEAILSLTSPTDAKLADWNLRVRSDDRGLMGKVTAACRTAGFQIEPSSEASKTLTRPALRYGGADAFARALLLWVAKQFGTETPEEIQEFGAGDNDITLDLPSPLSLARPLRERVPVTVRVDAPEAFAAIAQRLRGAGFADVSLQQLTPSDDSRVTIDPGVLEKLGAHVELADITRALADAGAVLGVDWSLFPLQVTDRSEPTEAGVVIEMPLAAMRGGLLRPWSRLHPARYEVVILDDSRPDAVELMNMLTAAGFLARRQRLAAITEGFVMRCGSKVPAMLSEKISNILDQAILRLGAVDFGMSGQSAEGETIQIEYPARAWREGRLKAELVSPARFALKVIAPASVEEGPLMTEMKSWGFRSVRFERGSGDEPPSLKFGGARTELLDRIDAEVARQFGPMTLLRNKAWPMTDHDIYLRLPFSLAEPKPRASLFRRTGLPEPGMPVMPVPRPRAPSPPRGPLLTVTEREIRIADVVLPREPAANRHPRTPALARFVGFCIDQQVAETLVFVARALSGRHNVALEGPTAASKTWCMLYLAALVGVGVYRLNLSAQSDVSELVGRFVPDTERPGGFRFQYGPAPLAMMEGAWLMIDEGDLAPTEILERANSILEAPYPSLHLSEYDGREITDIDPRFRVLATWNGTAYAGRQELSPAFLDRFKIRVCAAPDESDYRALGACLVHGSQPDVRIGNALYRGGAGEALLQELASQIPDCERFLTALARFQAGIAAMAESGELRTRGRIAFTRRAFVDVLKEIRDRLRATGERRPDRQTVIDTVWQALSLCHLDRLNPASERPKAVTLLSACGIGPESWELPS